MLVFWDRPLVILATPKTGSTARQVALESLSTMAIPRPPVLKHRSVQRFHSFIGPYLEASVGARSTISALMRDARDGLGARFRFRQSDDLSDPA